MYNYPSVNTNKHDDIHAYCILVCFCAARWRKTNIEYALRSMSTPTTMFPTILHYIAGIFFWCTFWVDFIPEIIFFNKFFKFFFKMFLNFFPKIFFLHPRYHTFVQSSEISAHNVCEKWKNSIYAALHPPPIVHWHWFKYICCYTIICILPYQEISGEKCVLTAY